MKAITAIAAPTLLLTTSSALAASDFDFSGNFTRDDQVLQFAVPVGEASQVTVFTSSWNDGGFDPILAIFDSAGNLVIEQDDGGRTGSASSNGVSYDYDVYDTFFEVDLEAGDYTLTIQQYDNFAAGSTLGEGFTQQGNPNFTFDEDFGGATQPMFNGVFEDIDPRQSFYDIHFTGVDGEVVVIGGPDPDPDPMTPTDPMNPTDPNAVPTPSALGAGLATLLIAAGRRRRAQA